MVRAFEKHANEYNRHSITYIYTPIVQVTTLSNSKDDIHKQYAQHDIFTHNKTSSQNTRHLHPFNCLQHQGAFNQKAFRLLSRTSRANKQTIFAMNNQTTPAANPTALQSLPGGVTLANIDLDIYRPCSTKGAVRTLTTEAAEQRRQRVKHDLIKLGIRKAVALTFPNQLRVPWDKDVTRPVVEKWGKDNIPGWMG